MTEQEAEQRGKRHLNVGSSSINYNETANQKYKAHYMNHTGQHEGRKPGMKPENMSRTTQDLTMDDCERRVYME